MKNCLLSFFCAFFLFSAASQAQTIYYVKASSGSDANTGTSWASPFKNLTKALAAANASTAAEVQIWIAGGIYTPVDGIATLPADISDTSFVFYRGTGIGKALKIYGGFAGGETYISARNNQHPTYLDGFLGNQKSYHVAVISGLASGADSLVLDGLTIQNGSASGSNTKIYNGVSTIQYAGGGLYIANNSASKVAIRNCVVRYDSAIGTDNTCVASSSGKGGNAYGGGVYLVLSSVLFDSCVISNNKVRGNNGGCTSIMFAGYGGSGYGGGMYLDSSVVTVNNCTFSNNITGGGNGISVLKSALAHGYGGAGYGGGLYIQSCSPSILNCLFSKNAVYIGGSGNEPVSYIDFSASYGGGLCNYKAYPTISNCKFLSNSAICTPLIQYGDSNGISYGGGLSNLYSNPSVVNCDFDSNVSTGISSSYNGIASIGGGVYNSFSDPYFSKCVFSHNNAGAYDFGSGGGMFNFLSSPVISNCIFSSNVANAPYIRLNNYPDLFGGGGAIANDGSSPAISNCNINANSANVCGGAILNSANSNPVFNNCSVTKNFVVASGYGGAIYNASSAPVFINCNIDSNYTSKLYFGHGGAAFNTLSNSVFKRCNIRYNKSEKGAGFYNFYSSVTIDSCLFMNDSAIVSEGGAIYQQVGFLSLQKCIFSKNYSEGGGGAIYVTGDSVQFSSFGSIYINNKALGNDGIGGGAICSRIGSNFTDTLLNNLFAGNVNLFGSGGGGLHMIGAKHIVCNNTFFADTTVAYNSYGGALRFEGNGILNLSNNIFYKSVAVGKGTIYPSIDTSIVATGSINISNNLFSTMNPTFVDPSNLIGTDGVWGTADDGLQLQACSQAINAGSNAFVISGELTDITDRNRINSTSVDVGAYEAYLVAPVSGVSEMCVGTTTIFTDATAGGTWATSDSTVVTISANGTIKAMSPGIAVVTYAVSFGCENDFSSKSILIEMPASASAILGMDTVCAGVMTMLSDSATNGTWSSGDTVVGTVATSGIFTGLTQGTTTITYSVTNACGTSNANKTITVQRTASPILGADTVCEGKSITLTDSAINGIWHSSDPGVASVANGIVTGTGAGVATISYDVSNTCGTSGRSHKVIVLSKAKCDSLAGVNTITAVNNITVYPNPANDIINIDAPFAVNIILTGSDGKLYRQMQQVKKVDIKNLPDGLYLLGIYDTNWNRIKIEEVIKK